MLNLSYLHSAHVLVVDDCFDTCGVLCALLTQVGYENVSSMTDGKLLLDGETGNYFSLIVLDMHMPTLDGLEIMRHLRSKQTGYCVPVIAISGDQRYRTVAIAAGAYAFLLKPFNRGGIGIHNLQCAIKLSKTTCFSYHRWIAYF